MFGSFQSNVNFVDGLDARAALPGEHHYALPGFEAQRFVLHYGDELSVVKAHRHFVAATQGMLEEAWNSGVHALHEHFAHALDHSGRRGFKRGLRRGQRDAGNAQAEGEEAPRSHSVDILRRKAVKL